MADVKRKFKARDLVNKLKGEIDSGMMSPDTPLLSASKMAELYGMSQITVNRAVKALADEGYVYRVQGSGTFVSDRASKSGRKLVVGIGVNMPGGDGMEILSSYGIIRDAAVNELRTRGHEAVYFTGNDMRDPSSAANLLQKLDGVIMSRGFVVEDNLRLLSEFDGQIVLIQHQEPSPYPFHQVIHDYRPGMRVALRDLRQKGVRKLAVAGANFYTSFFRRDRLLEVAAEEGFGKSDIKVFSEDLMVGDFGRMIGGKIGKSYLSEYAEAGEYPAIFSLSDFISFGIYDELLCAGLEPGKDVLLASYDDLETGGMLPFGKPVISSVVHPFREISIEAVKVLLESMEADDGIRKIHIVPATGYIKRKSTEG